MNCYRERIDQIIKYLQSTDQDTNKFICILKEEFKSMGVIDGGDVYHWTSPDNTYSFEINRVGNTFVTDTYSPQYTNIITVKDMIGIKILELKFSEYDCVNILALISSFCEDHFSDTMKDPNISDQIFIDINPNDTTMIINTIHIQFSTTNKNICRVKFLQTNRNNNRYTQNVVEIFHLVLDFESLVEMCFYIFCCCIIDLDFEILFQSGLEDEYFAAERLVYGDIKDLVKTPKIQANQINSVPLDPNQ